MVVHFTLIDRNRWSVSAWYRSCVSWLVSLMSYVKISVWWRYVNAVSVKGACRYSKVMEFKVQIFRAGKVMESDVGPEKSGKIMGNQPNVCHIFDPCTCFRPLYRLSLFSMHQLCCHQMQSNCSYLKFLVKVTNSYVAQSCDFNGRP